MSNSPNKKRAESPSRKASEIGVFPGGSPQRLQAAPSDIRASRSPFRE